MSFSKRLLSGSNPALVAGENFKAVTYTGDGNAGRAVTVGFKPDYVWIKARSNTNSWTNTDSSRGVNAILSSNATASESNFDSSWRSSYGQIASFTSTGFTVNAGSSSGNFNTNGTTYVAYCWKANEGNTSTNTDGEITTTVQANQNAGFSIVTFAGISDPGEDRSFGHGLSQEPEFIWMKRREAAQHLAVFVKINGTWEYFDGTSSNDGGGDYSSYIATTSTVVDIHDAAEWFADASHNYVYWMWHSVDGYSKIGTYTGNASDNGPIVETGFEPAFVMIKRVDSSENWAITDNARNTTNPRNKAVFPNLSEAELTSGYTVDYLSNGFQIATSGAGVNASGGTFMYMAFAADPDIEAPTLADSFKVKTYTGTGSATSITGFGFSPNFVWGKNRDANEPYWIYDTIRGPNKLLESNSTIASTTVSNRLTGFESDGFTIGGSDGSINGNGVDYVAWAWKADDNEPTIFGGPAKTVYKFEDNGNDVTGTLNLTESNMSYSSSGKFNKAAEFNGNNSSFTNGSITGLPTGTSPVSISYWVYTGTSNQDAGLVGYGRWNTGGTNSGAANKYFGTMLSGGDLFFAGYYYNTAFSPAVTLPTGQWNHLVWTYDGTNVRAYLNGSLAGTVNRSSLDIGGGSGNLSITIGRNSWSGTGSEHFDGKIDQVRIYSGKLEEYQVNELYNETASQNDDLSLGGPPETIISANANAGFSIVKYKGTGADMKVPHGLSAAPEMLIVKGLETTNDWSVLHKDGGNGDFLQLNSSSAESGAGSIFGSTFTRPTATVFTVGNTGETGTADKQYIAYCFHSVSGYSKIGSFTGNGNGSASNPIQTCGFRPDFVMLKNATDGGHWGVFDTERGGTGQNNKQLNVEGNSAEYTGSGGTDYVKFEDTGFRATTNGAAYNGNGKTILFMAFKMNPSPIVPAGQMAFLAVAGGGSGFAAWGGGGGGAGGLRTSFGSTSGGGSSAESNITLASGTYTITVGAGGAGGTGQYLGGGGDDSNNGVNSSIEATGLTTITSTGGGGAGDTDTGATGRDGGSGGGGSAQFRNYNGPWGVSGPGGDGTANQGYNGSSAGFQGGNNSYNSGGGGGGASATGGSTDWNAAANGGNGLSVSITGAEVSYAGGGGGGIAGLGNVGTGGTGGGGNGSSSGTGTAGTANTGGGAGGSYRYGNTFAAGGSGVVILRLLTSEYSGTTTGSPTITTVGDETILKYTGSGTYVHS